MYSIKHIEIEWTSCYCIFLFINMLSKAKSHIYIVQNYTFIKYIGMHLQYALVNTWQLSSTDELADSVLIIIFHYDIRQLWMTNNVGQSSWADLKYPKIVIFIRDFVYHGNHFDDWMMFFIISTVDFCKSFIHLFYFIPILHILCVMEKPQT